MSDFALAIRRSIIMTLGLLCDAASSSRDATKSVGFLHWRRFMRAALAAMQLSLAVLAFRPFAIGSFGSTPPVLVG